ncbi:hypothetical protein GQ54DRAFT_265216 [Martensiomyces pterosporus]|nr:hypothetical protein GQ54DRAFT_265216 [Martensiomyces pterosporus]
METESEGILTSSLRNKSRSESSSDSEDQSKGGSKGYNGEINRILYGWLSQHATNPYPSADEKRILMRDTGLSKMQLKNWLCNVRRRKLTGTIKRGSSSKRPKG